MYSREASYDTCFDITDAYKRHFRGRARAAATVVLLLIVGLLAPVRASAALITIPLAGGTVIDFSQFDDFVFTAGPVDVGNVVGEDVIWTTTFDNSYLGSNGTQPLGDNGEWNSGRAGWAGLNTHFGSMTFTFDSGPVSIVTAFINYIPNFADVWLEALGTNGQVLESYNLSLAAPIVTPHASNAGAFRGISRASDDIAAIRVSNSFVVVDDLGFLRRQKIPEPVSLLLLSLGIGASLARRRRPPTVNQRHQ